MDIPIKNKDEESNDFDSKKAELERLVELCLMDGVLTDKERLVLLKKAEELGIDKDAFEIELEAELYKRNQKGNKERDKENEKKELYKLADGFLSDGELNDEERDILHDKAKKLGIDLNEFDSYLARELSEVRNGIRNSAFVKQNVKSDEKRDNKSTKEGLSFSKKLLIVVILAVIGLIVVFSVTKSKNVVSEPMDLSVYVKENPQLVFQKVTFSKFMVLSSRRGGNEHFEKQTAFHVRATGNYYFELDNLEVVDQVINGNQKIIYLTYNCKTMFPVAIDVDIAQKDIVKVESFDPTPISDSEAEAIAQPLSFVAGGLGAWIGGKFGSSLGNGFGTIGKIIGTGAGAAAGGAAAGQFTYVKTKNYLAGLQLASGYTVEESEALIFGAKQLMAAEMIGIDFSDLNCEKSAREHYEKQMEKCLSSVLWKLGWTEVHIQFKYEN